VSESELRFTGTKIVGYNRFRFLIESLEDLNNSFSIKYGGNLNILRGQPVELFKKLSQKWKIAKICFEQVRMSNVLYFMFHLSALGKQTDKNMYNNTYQHAGSEKLVVFWWGDNILSYQIYESYKILLQLQLKTTT